VPSVFFNSNSPVRAPPSSFAFRSETRIPSWSSFSDSDASYAVASGPAASVAVVKSRSAVNGRLDFWLNGAVGTGAGDEAGGADYRPTDTQIAVLETIEKDLDAARTEYQALLKTVVPAMNKRGLVQLK